jgi:hypothetical protein
MLVYCTIHIQSIYVSWSCFACGHVLLVGPNPARIARMGCARLGANSPLFYKAAHYIDHNSTGFLTPESDLY